MFDTTNVEKGSVSINTQRGFEHQLLEPLFLQTADVFPKAVGKMPAFATGFSGRWGCEMDTNQVLVSHWSLSVGVFPSLFGIPEWNWKLQHQKKIRTQTFGAGIRFSIVTNLYHAWAVSTKCGSSGSQPEIPNSSSSQKKCQAYHLLASTSNLLRTFFFAHTLMIQLSRSQTSDIEIGFRPGRLPRSWWAVWIDCVVDFFVIVIVLVFVTFFLVGGWIEPPN